MDVPPSSKASLYLSPSKDPSIASGLTRDADKYNDALLLGGTSIDIDPSGEYIYLLGDNDSLTGGNVYLPRDESLWESTETD